MNPITAISSVGVGLGAGAAAPVTAAGGPGGLASFADTLGKAMNQLNGSLVGADAAAADFAAGKGDIASVMLKMSDASLGLKLAVNVRDKLLTDYEEIMRLQI